MRGRGGGRGQEGVREGDEEVEERRRKDRGGKSRKQGKELRKEFTSVFSSRTCVLVGSVFGQ